jgi:hypothetical protein
MLKKSFYTSVIAGDISTIAGLGGGVNLVIWLLQLGESVFGDRHQFMQLQAADALADFFCNLCTNKRICCTIQNNHDVITAKSAKTSQKISVVMMNHTFFSTFFHTQKRDQKHTGSSG